MYLYEYSCYLHMFNCVHVIIQLHWYRDKSIYIIYQNIIFHLKVHNFLLILKEINTFHGLLTVSWALGIMHFSPSVCVISVLIAPTGTSLPRIGT